MLMMNHPGKTSYEIFNWPEAAIKAHIGFMISLNKELTANGELIGCEGLQGPHEAKLVRASDTGTPITDGVFPESKEFLAGYWIVDVPSPERAYAIAAKASTAPGADGKPLNMNIEVREVMSGPPPDML
ncbi:YciI family protein [Roseiterribacter gracilis]